MAGRGLPPERVQEVLDHLAAGLNPMQVARAAGVSKSFVYRLDQKASGVSRLAAKRQAAVRRAAGRAAGPGRRVAPERLRLLLDHLAAGMNPNQAGPAAGVSKSFAYRLHHTMGGVYRPPGTTYSDRYLDREERYEMARLRESGLSMREVARRLGRAPSTVSRELARNADPRTGAYQPERAHRLAWDRQRRPKPSKLAQNPVLRCRVQQLLDRRYSPQQVSGRLNVAYPDDPAMRVSHETIYQSIYLYPRGGLRRELKACLRTGREVRRRRGRREARGRIIDAVPIGQRPPEAEGRLSPRPPRRRPDHGLQGLQLRRRHHRRADHRLPHPAPAARRPRRRLRRRRHHRPPGRPARLVRQDPHLGPRPRARPPQARHRRHRHRRVLRRPLLTLAARQQREHQRPAPRIPPQRHRPQHAHPRPAPGHRRRTQRPAPQTLRLPHPPRTTR